jgi:hypothetical protein
VLRRLLFLADVLLLVAAGFLVVHLHQVWPESQVVTLTPSAPAGVTAARTSAAPTPTGSPGRPALTAYAVIAERNLFSPSRTETPPEAPRPQVATAPTPPPPRPRLYGVVLLPDGKSRAYLEDVQRRRVFAYSAGDSVAGSQVEQIRADRVVLRRGTETFEVLLRDPSKPRPAPTPAPGPAPATPGAPRPPVGAVPGPAGTPGVRPGGPVAPPVPLPPAGVSRRPPVPRGAIPEAARPEPPDPGPQGEEDEGE